MPACLTSNQDPSFVGRHCRHLCRRLTLPMPEPLSYNSCLCAAALAPTPAGGHDPSWRGLKAVELYDPVQDCWRHGPMLPSALPFAGAGVPTRGQVYIIGGGECCSHDPGRKHV